MASAHSEPRGGGSQQDETGRSPGDGRARAGFLTPCPTQAQSPGRRPEENPRAWKDSGSSRCGRGRDRRRGPINPSLFGTMKESFMLEELVARGRPVA